MTAALFFRQIESAPGHTYDGLIFACINEVVTSCNASDATLTFTDVALPAHPSDFGTLGFDEPAGVPGTTITSVTISLDDTGIFKSIKQIDFSCNFPEAHFCAVGVPGGGGGGIVPEPSTWAMMLLGFAGLGFAGLGFAGYRKTRTTASMMA